MLFGILWIITEMQLNKCKNENMFLQNKNMSLQNEINKHKTNNNITPYTPVWKYR